MFFARFSGKYKQVFVRNFELDDFLGELDKISIELDKISDELDKIPHELDKIFTSQTISRLVRLSFTPENLTMEFSETRICPKF